jgi:hypothetical protein
MARAGPHSYLGGWASIVPGTPLSGHKPHSTPLAVAANRALPAPSAVAKAARAAVVTATRGATLLADRSHAEILAAARFASERAQHGSAVVYWVALALLVVFGTVLFWILWLRLTRRRPD